MEAACSAALECGVPTYRFVRQLRLSGMTAALEARLRQARAERLAPLDLLAALVTDELATSSS